ncbi:glucokinase [Micractinium conductrix]|uniref:Glucokinase n=1 Tax=Micractinium conductrix TaxID=554055 RepID=A0A2P6VAW4_9CHLO|nr:glucokinase [Micractinium conductrix]|eukprot:PSC71239.1 glucokinase [Micractinium conductrix]
MFQAAAKTDVLIADIGGTNCRFQVWQLDAHFRPSRMVVEQYYATKDYPHFADALDALLSLDVLSGAARPTAAAFACAGPVKSQRCTMTNLGWTIDAAEIQKKFDIRCTVLNDFEAIGYGVPVLTDNDLVVLNDVPAEDKGPKAVLGPGTGLGEAQLFWDDRSNGYKVHASEGAHATFAPRGWKQRALQAHVEAERGHCSVERVACGSGLVRIYDFLRSDEPSQYPQDRMDRGKQVTPADVTNSGLDKSDAVAVEALDMFLSIVGAEAGHMALRGLTSGGVYICGGIFPKVIERVKAGGVLEAFLWRASRFYEKVLKDIPLYVVTEEKLGLLGTREQAIRIAQEIAMERTIAS